MLLPVADSQNGCPAVSFVAERVMSGKKIAQVCGQSKKKKSFSAQGSLRCGGEPLIKSRVELCCQKEATGRFSRAQLSPDNYAEAAVRVHALLAHFRGLSMPFYVSSAADKSRP